LDKKIRTRSRVSRRRALVTALGAILLLAGWAKPALAERRLAFAVAGVVEAVMVRPGQKVAKGAALARLDLRPLEAEANAAAAELKTAQLEHELAVANMERVQQLYDDLSTSKEELERATLRLARGEAGLARAEATDARAQWRLERGTLSAPVAGVIQSITGYIGLVVDPAARFTPVVVMK